MVLILDLHDINKDKFHRDRDRKSIQHYANLLK